MTTTELARRADVVTNLDDVQRVARLLSLSGYFDAKGTAEQAIAQLATKILAGREMGFDPFASANGIHIIQGKPTVSANLMAAAVKGSSRYDYRVREHTDTVCKLEFFERINGKLESLGVSSFTLEDGKRAGTQNLNKFPRNMLFARAMSNGVRFYCPDVFNSGVYTPEEIGATVNGNGEIIEVPGTPVVEAIPQASVWERPQEAIEWAVSEGLDADQARAILVECKNAHGGKLNSQTAPMIYEDYQVEVDRALASMGDQPELLHGGGAVYN